MIVLVYGIKLKPEASRPQMVQALVDHGVSFRDAVTAIGCNMTKEQAMTLSLSLDKNMIKHSVISKRKL